MESVTVFPEQTVSQLKAVWQRWAQWPQLSPGLATRWSKWVRSRRKSRTGKRGAGPVWSQSKLANSRWRGKYPAPPEQTRLKLLRLQVSFCLHSYPYEESVFQFMKDLIHKLRYILHIFNIFCGFKVCVYLCALIKAFEVLKLFKKNNK